MPIYGGEERCIQAFGGEACRKGTLERPKLSFDDNIKLDLQEIGWGLDWTDMTHGRCRWPALVKAVGSPINCEKFLE